MNKWYMGGTDGTGEYVVVAIGEYGRIGYRDLNNGSYRVRVEPEGKWDSVTTQAMAKELTGWNQPDGSCNRISLQVKGSQEMFKALTRGLTVLGKIQEMNEDIDDDEVKDIVAASVSVPTKTFPKEALNAVIADLEKIIGIAEDLAEQVNALRN